MALTFPTVNGNWSNPAIWSGSTLPTVNDDVYGNNKSVYIDQNVNVRSIKTIAAGSAVAGGVFEISSSVSISATVDGIVGGSGASILSYSGSGTINIYGNIFGATGAAAKGMILNGSGTVNIVGNLFAGTGPGAVAIYINSRNTVNVIGNLYPTATNYCDAIISLTSGSQINVTGDLYGASANFAVNMQGSSSLSVTGNCYPLSTNGTSVIYASGIGSRTVLTGTVNSAFPTPLASAVILSTTSQSLDLTGNVFSSTGVPAVTVTSATSNVILRGVNLINSFQILGFSRMAVFAPCYTIVPSNQFRWTFYDTGSTNTTTLFVQGYIPDSPSQADVRFGTTYLNGALSGSLQMPQPSQVISGVKTDNTTGSYNVTVEALTEAVWSKLTSTLTGSNTIGERLKNNSTIDSTGQQLQALI